MDQELEKIIQNAIRYKENADYLDSSIVLIATKEIKKLYEPIVNSLKEANDQNSNLLQEKLKLENVISELKKMVVDIDNNEESVSSEVSEEIINTCEKKLNYTKCVIWTAAEKGCAECEFYKP
jgi:predicted  nucleic acid-binding Zn-ribbon protein